MGSSKTSRGYRSIFSPNTRKEREENFERYWLYTQEHDGEILEEQKNLAIKKAILADFQIKKVRSQRPLDNPQLFYRNYHRMRDDPRALDRKTQLLTCIYKFARHEWVGISAAWEATPPLAQAQSLTDKISRYHLCEEFCHVRLFHEMFRTFHLEEVKWIPPGKGVQSLYKIFPRLPERLMSGPAFLTELMGMMFYVHVDQLLDEVFSDEPEARDHLRALLHEIMIDELAHIGQRRNYMGGLSLRLAKWLFRPLLYGFFRDIPEAKYLLNFNQMVSEGLAFDYNLIPGHLLKRSWVPTYCLL